MMRSFVNKTQIVVQTNSVCLFDHHAASSVLTSCTYATASPQSLALSLELIELYLFYVGEMDICNRRQLSDDLKIKKSLASLKTKNESHGREQ